MTKGLTINLSYLPVINFAMQQNHVPVIREITLKNTGEETINDIDIIVRFEPEFALEYCTHIDSVAPATEEKISVVPISISTEFLSNLTERITGSINLTARTGEDVLAEKHSDISILTFNEWGGSNVMPEVLAAFSTPNHPEISLIKKRASEILARWTGNPSLNAYQDRDHNRVKFQMAAIYEAISEKAITYCVSPASFESQGQRIRTVDEIFALKMGNCLDMTMLYAGCLESIGLHPLVILTDDHAFAGCWLIPDSFADSYNDDSSLITKRMADGMNEVLVVECTAMNEGSAANFDSACAAAKQTLLTTEKFSFFIDVCRARVSQIRPLPLRTTDENGKYIVEDKEITRDNSAPTEMSATDLVIDSKAEVNKKTIWERKLLDLSLRNNLLNLRLTRGTIPFISSNINAFEDALANNEDFKICPRPTDWDCELLSDGIYKTINATDPIHDLIQQELPQNRIRTYLDEDRLRKSLTHLYRSAKTSMEENGANTLYLALGLLKWYETPTSQKPRFAPILLIPVEIVRKSAASGYVLRSRDEDTMLNITLLELLRQMFNITIGGLDPLPKDHSGIDTSLVFNTIRRKIMEQKNWDVIEQAVLGNFSFSKFIMWNDIHNNSDILCKNPIVSSLMNGVVDESVNAEISEDGDLDEKFKAGDIVLPISADSSQIEAITAALSGKSFILHGPPGTGKSQTITNIIANALYRGKKVLFVAEKMAALEVVQNRLNAIGLGPFCLELHSNKAKKATVLEQLKRTTEVTKTKSADEFRIEAEHINNVRYEMNACIKALHKTYPLGVSLYDCISRYASISEDCPIFDMTTAKAGTVTSDMVAKMEIALDDLRAALTIIGNPADNPLRGIGSIEYNAEIDETLASIPYILELIDSIEQMLMTLCKEVLASDDSHVSKADYDLFIELAYPLSDEYLYEGIISETLESLKDIKSATIRGRNRDEVRAKLISEYDESLLGIDTKAYEAEWREVLSKGFIGRYFGTKKYLRKLATYCSKPIGADNVLTLLKDIASYQQDNEVITRMEHESPFLQSVMNGYETDWKKVQASCRLAEEVRRIINKHITDHSRMEAILGRLSRVLAQRGRSFFDKIINDREMLRETLAKALHKLGANMPEQPGPDDDIFGTTREMLTRWHSGRDKIRSWVMYNKHKESAVTLGFEEIIRQIEAGGYGPDILKDAFHKTLYKAYAEYILTQESDLQLFHGTMFEEKIRRFRGLCKDFETLTKEELYAKIASGLPALQKEASHSSEVGILQRNIRNGCRGISLRSFFASIPDLLHRMCPCMLMSPISVAQYIKADGMKFDLVIFDEASQMPTCEAVGTIARGKSIIVVGDPKQLPPTSFFSSNTYDEDNPHLEDLESILDDCLALTLPSKHLRWHYRSKHESLIAFSNSKYYENKLHTFPSPDDLQTKIGYQHVEGTYDRGGSRQNRAEAEAIITEIKNRLEDPARSSMSIGVVTFNSNQQSLLEDLLNDLFVTRPDLERIALECEEPIFIKNLENVQGDERDVILFSIGYGQDKQGKITLNFGPLNRDGGWRRLNVAVSRARYEMKIFSTLRSEQIDLRRTSAEGVVGLKEFLEYAEKGKNAGINSSASSSSYDGFVEAVAKTLKEKGYDVRTNIGSSGYKIDIGVVNPEDSSSYILGILCDGYNFASSRSARDREIVQVSVLRRLGWKIWRIWSMDWWTNRDAVIQELCSKIEDAIAGRYVEAEEEPIRLYGGSAGNPTGTSAISNTPIEDQTYEEKESLFENDGDATESNEEPETGGNIVPYVFSELEQCPLPVENVVNGYHDHILMKYIEQVIEQEAPITKDLLCKRVLRAVNIARMGSRVAGQMYYIIKRMNLKKTDNNGEVFWRHDQNPDEYQTIRCSNEREATYIPFEEARNAAIHVLNEQGAQPKESLVREMAKLFGYTRVGDNVYYVMLSGIELAEKEGRLQEVNGRTMLKQ